jgi:hypothetical protein
VADASQKTADDAVAAYNKAVASGNLTMPDDGQSHTSLFGSQVSLLDKKIKISVQSPQKIFTLKIKIGSDADRLNGPEADRLKIIADAAVKKAAADKAAADKAAADKAAADKAAAEAKAAADTAVAEAKAAADKAAAAEKAATELKTAADKAKAEADKAKAEADKAKAEADKAKAEAANAQAAAAIAQATAQAKVLAAQAAKKLAEDAKKTLDSLKAKVKKTTGIDTSSLNPTAEVEQSTEVKTQTENLIPKDEANSGGDSKVQRYLLLIFLILIALLILRKKISQKAHPEEVSLISPYEILPSEALTRVKKPESSPKVLKAKKAPLTKKASAKKAPPKKTSPARKKVTKKAPAKKEAVAKKRANN